MAGAGFMEPVAWHASLPGVIVAASALIRDPAGNVLVVKPNYRDHWTLPGGICEFGEAPHDGCAREVSEELGLDLAVGPLLSVDWQPALPDYGPGARPAIYFIFGCGTLADRGGIRLQAEELDDSKFAAEAELAGLLAGFALPRVRIALAARGGDCARYVPRASGGTSRASAGPDGGAAASPQCQAAGGPGGQVSGGRGPGSQVVSPPRRPREPGKPVSLAHGGRAERGGQVGLQRREDIGH